MVQIDTLVPAHPLVKELPRWHFAREKVKPRKLITGEELYRMGDLGRTELVKGVIIYKMPTGHPHGFVEFSIARHLGNLVIKDKLGQVFVGETGIYTKRKPDTVRGMDVAFMSNERLAQVKSKSYLDVAPELVVEVLSPDDTWSEVNEKLEEYFAIGVQQVWVADPRRHVVHVYDSPTHVEQLTVKDTLSGGTVLPGFSIAVAELFGIENI